MKLQIKYFGLLAEKTGNSNEVLDVPEELIVSQLIEELETKYPPLTKGTYRVSHNQTLVDSDFIVQENAEIALLPPFAGG